MTDKELLELAAKAAGIEVRYQPISHRFLTQKQLSQREGHYFAYWNPLTDDGDALRLAVKLGILDNHEIGIAPVNVWADEDPYAATRRAIVRAAAEIGKETK